MNLNAMNHIEAGKMIYEQNAALSSISFLFKGTVEVIRKGTGINFVLGAGYFIALDGLCQGEYNFTYRAVTDLDIYTFQITKSEDIKEILKINSEYHGRMVMSMSRLLYETDEFYQLLHQKLDNLYEIVTNTEKNYKYLIGKTAYSGEMITIPDGFDQFHTADNPASRTVAFYKSISKIPLDVCKQYYDRRTDICLYQLEEQAKALYILNNFYSQLSDYCNELLYLLLNENDKCFYKFYARMAIELSYEGKDDSEAVRLLDHLKNDVITGARIAEQVTGSRIDIDVTLLETIYKQEFMKVVQNVEVKDEEVYVLSEEDRMKAISLCNNTLGQLIAYSELPEEETIKLNKAVTTFLKCNDKYAISETMNKLRTEVSGLFFSLYEKVFLKAALDTGYNRIVDLFLNYGLLDERLLTEEQIVELFYLKNVTSETECCRVYSMKDWLMQIYLGNKQPSKNEFDMDYTEMVRKKKQQEHLTPKQERDELENAEKKVSFEINNLFRYNSRLLNGKIRTAVPFLHEGEFEGRLESLALTANIIENSIRLVRNTDYSVFYREVSYLDREKGILKEFIQKEVFPDIILFPICGVNGMMWQEISDKRRENPGRFLLPAFLKEINIMDLMIRLLGRFRWELCRRIQGSAWNNVQIPSLTSEYEDYIQFYRKNKELSEEKKEKIKTQISKYRGNDREIFVSDYEVWIKNESTGMIRLNKVVREMFAMYCPFAKEIREKIGKQPLFEEAMSRYYRLQRKKLKEVDNHYLNLSRQKIEMTDELKNNRKFYSDF